MDVKPSTVDAQAPSPPAVLFKLMLFAVALGAVPLGTYFASEKYVWPGNANYAALAAVLSANAVLVAYIILSILEDNGPTIKSTDQRSENKKDR